MRNRGQNDQELCNAATFPFITLGHGEAHVYIAGFSGRQPRLSERAWLTCALRLAPTLHACSGLIGLPKFELLRYLLSFDVRHSLPVAVLKPHAFRGYGAVRDCQLVPATFAKPAISAAARSADPDVGTSAPPLAPAHVITTTPLHGDSLLSTPEII